MRQSHFLSVAINACHCEPVWCSAQRIKILMTASGSHTLIYATLVVFLLVCTEIGIVIANQSADWCGNPPVLPRIDSYYFLIKILILIRKASPEGAASFVIYKERNHKTSLI